MKWESARQITGMDCHHIDIREGKDGAFNGDRGPIRIASFSAPWLLRWV